MFVFLFSNTQINNYSAATSPLWSVQKQTKQTMPSPRHCIPLLCCRYSSYRKRCGLQVGATIIPTLDQSCTGAHGWRRGLNLPCSLGDHTSDFSKVTKASLRERSFILKDNIYLDRSIFCCFSRVFLFWLGFFYYTFSSLCPPSEFLPKIRAL